MSMNTWRLQAITHQSDPSRIRIAASRSNRTDLAMPKHDARFPITTNAQPYSPALSYRQNRLPPFLGHSHEARKAQQKVGIIRHIPHTTATHHLQCLSRGRCSLKRLGMRQVSAAPAGEGCTAAAGRLVLPAPKREERWDVVLIGDAEPAVTPVPSYETFRTVCMDEGQVGHNVGVQSLHTGGSRDV